LRFFTESFSFWLFYFVSTWSQVEENDDALIADLKERRSQVRWVACFLHSQFLLQTSFFFFFLKAATNHARNAGAKSLTID